jgi:hypothetical protein
MPAKKAKSLHKNLFIEVTQADIDNARRRSATDCMVKHAVARAINAPHGYVHIDASGVSITRNGEYREKSDLPRIALVKFREFDDEEEEAGPRGQSKVTPFSFWLHFRKTSKIIKLSREQKDAQNLNRTTLREARRADGTLKQYNQRLRYDGVAMSEKKRKKA